jgi:hypothetical protein
MTIIGRLLRRGEPAEGAPVLDPRPWAESRTTIGSKRPEGWTAERVIVRRGVRGGISPRTAPRVVQIRVDTQ